VSLALPGGDAVAVMGSTVRLIPHVDSLEALLDLLCQVYATRFRAVALGLPLPLRIDSIPPSRSELATMRPRELEMARRRWGERAGATLAMAGGLDTLRALQNRTEASVRTTLVPFTAGRVTTDNDARYRFDSLPAGPYVLWAEARIGDNDYTWWAETTVVAGDAMQLALDSSRLSGSERFCHIR
jgi:hypothetical protein